MPPKKKKKGNDQPEPEKTAPPDDHIDEFIIESAEGGSIEEPKQYTWQLLIDELVSLRQAQDDERPDLDRLGTLYIEEAEASTRKQAWNDAKSVEIERFGRCTGKTDATKRAKAASLEQDAIVKELRRLAKYYTRKNRQERERGLMGAQARIEDFLYFQETIRRWKRSRAINPDKRRELQAERLQRRISYKIELSGNDTGYYDWVHDVLDYYDRRGVGSQRYRRGEIDRLGNAVPIAERVVRPPVGPAELHLWTPVWRRRPVGLYEANDGSDVKVDNTGGINDGGNSEDIVSGGEAAEKEREDNGEEAHENIGGAAGENNSEEARQELEPLQFDLDHEAIEAERRRIEEQDRGETMDGTIVPTHPVRRAWEVLSFPRNGPGPNTSNVRPRFESGELITEHPWDRFRTEQGLFISAKEDSWDWLTSYDCLDRIVLRHIPTVIPTSAIRDDPPFETDDNDDMIWERDYPSDQDQDLPEPAMEPEEGENAAPAVAKKAATKKRKRKATLSFRSRKKKTGPANSKSAASTKDVAGEVNDSWKRRRANIDYPYRKAEFCRKKVPIQTSLDELEHGPTDWAEESTGRREWHAYQLLSPCSSVDSPPRTPIRENIIEEENAESIPRIGDGTESDSNGTWRVVPDGSMPDLEPNRRRCETDKCCAWWMHPREECLIVHSERTQKCSTVGCRIWREHSRDKCADMPLEAHEEARRRSGTDQALMYNDEPRILPESGVSVYVDRLHDHYGIRQPKSQEARWPKLGIRVPYAPMTFDDLKIDHHRRPSDPKLGDDIADPRNGGFIAKDARKRVVHCMRSLDVPIIKRAQEDWGRVDDDPPASSGRNSPGGNDDDAESDDEGDLFRASYMEGSGPATAGLDHGNPIDLTEEPSQT